MRFLSIKFERGASEQPLSQERAEEALAIIRETRDNLDLEGHPLFKKFAQVALLVAAKAVRLERTVTRTPDGKIARSLERGKGVRLKF